MTRKEMNNKPPFCFGNMGLSAMCFQVVVVEMLLLVVAALSATQLLQAKPGCPSKCGNLEIPYPFGTKHGCYLNKDFLITCNDTYNPPNPFLWRSNLPVTNITMEGLLQTESFVSIDCYNGTGSWASLRVQSNSITISKTQNKFTVIGCDSYGYISGKLHNKTYEEGCISRCESPKDVTEGSCSGSGCCQIDIPEGLQQINVTAYTFNRSRHREVLNMDNPCSYAFVIEDSELHFSVKNLSTMPENVPTVTDWAITGHGKCKEANKTTNFACNENASCYDPANNNLDGYLCNCNHGYRGNPYLSDGCLDINECEEEKNPCRKNAHCVNTPGSYTCECNRGYHGNGTKDGDGCIRKQPLTIIVLCMSLGFVILFVGSFWLYFLFRKRRLNNIRENFFQQNGGFLLQQQLSKRNGTSNAAKIYSEEELKKATDNFDEERIIGRGGYGTVYKGLLIDNYPVAIKKSKIVNQDQIEQFINEVIVLSQINHRNVVKLLGCCLETEVPLLVYEYVTNGTLFDHIHNKDKAPTICWETRLRIAVETAEALSYLHFGAATPIIHRDVKSTNILLDDTFTAKVSDFGISKLVPMNETQITTMVQGTLGYLDPEYMHTSQLTEKSDVYSFGVILVELMTGKKVLSFDRPEDKRNLANYFLSSWIEGSFFEILDNGIANDDHTEEIKRVAELARRCLKVKGEERPTMKEVATELEGLIRMKKHMWDNVEVNIEETKHSLSDPSYAYSDGGGSTSTTMYDSTKDPIQPVPFDGGR